MEPEVHIQAPEAAQEDGAHKEHRVEHIGHRPAAGKELPVDQEACGLHDAAGDGDKDHQIVQDIPCPATLHAAQPGGPEEQHEQHADSVDHKYFRNVYGIHHGPPFLRISPRERVIFFHTPIIP